MQQRSPTSHNHNSMRSSRTTLTIDLSLVTGDLDPGLMLIISLSVHRSPLVPGYRVCVRGDIEPTRVYVVQVSALLREFLADG